MALCTLCMTNLGMLNRPTFGQGKLADGTEICFNCFSKIRKVNPAASFKGMTSIEAAEMMSASSVNQTKILDRAEQIRQQVKAMGVSSFFGGKEIAELPKILSENEEIIDIVQGVYEKAIGVLVATNLRLLFLDKGFFSSKVEDFPYDKISSIQYETGLVTGTILLTVSGNKSKIENVAKPKVKAFAETVRAKLSALGESKQPQQVIVQQGVDVADQLSKLADLKEKGILTEDEFQAQKHKLLNL